MSKIYRIANRFLAEFSDDGYTADVELFREGAWKHPAAPGGWFKVTKERIQNFINNFNRKICGPEIPLEFSHLPDSSKTPGFAVQLYEKVADGISSLWGKLRFTDNDIAKKIKDGSIKWVSPTVVSDYEDTASGQLFEVIRSITLTNYPHIKNLHPMVVNFEEVLNQEGQMTKTAQEILKENELLLENLEAITLEDLDKKIDVEYLSEEQITDLAEHFEMTEEQFQEKYPEAGKKSNTYGTRPKIPAPKGLKKEDREKFFAAFNKLYDKYKDVEKAKAAALKKLNMEEDTTAPKSVKEFVEKFVSSIKRGFGLEDEVKPDEIDDPKVKVKLEEQQREITELRMFKDKAEFAEDKTTVETFGNMTPAAKNILTTLLNVGRRSELEFEEDRISVHDLVRMFLEEVKKSPSVNLFEIKSRVEDSDIDLEDEGKRRDARVQQLMKEDKEISYRQALDRVLLEEKQGGK